MSHHEIFHLVGISEWSLVFKILNIEAFQVLDFEDHLHIGVHKALYLPECRTSPYGVVVEEYYLPYPAAQSLIPAPHQYSHLDPARPPHP